MVAVCVSGSDDEYRLINKLLSSYDVNVLPNARADQPVIINMDMSLLQILDLVG